MHKAPVQVEETDEDKIEVVIQEKEETTEEEVPPQPKRISFSGTSIEKDLKIKIVDELGALVTGMAFKITVTPQKGNQSREYIDEDMDGIIHITDMTPGKYTVQLHDTEGFLIAEHSIPMTVKNKIEYKKVDVKNEIKKESEVDLKKEEAPVQKPKEESKLQDTVALLESSKNEVVVAKDKVDLSTFPKATAGEKKNQATIMETATVAVPGTIMLYDLGSDASKTYCIQPEVTGEVQVIQGYAWKSDVDGIFTCTVNEDQSVLVSAAKVGTANLSLLIEYDDVTELSRVRKQTEIQIAVTVSEITDDKTQLKDNEGSVLYLDEERKQSATLKDYGKAKEFYTIKYTGWQTIDEKLYYFDKNHQPVTGIQVIGGGRYTFGKDGALLKTQEQRGIDVSKYQENIDWNAVANAGIDYAIIRVGYRGYSVGSLVEDPWFKRHIEGATKAGLKVGVYFFTQAITQAEAIEEASMALSLVAGYRLQLPIYIDTEAVYGNDGSPGRANGLSTSERTAIVKAFCETVRNAGYMPGVYASTSWYNNQLKASQLEMYAIWVAQYADACAYKGRYDMWQYTSKGSVPGINGRVDLNISYVAY